jgi:hypothetical protein
VTTPTLTVGPLTLNASSLELTYAAASTNNGNVDTFTVAGNAGFTLDGNTVELQLGDTHEGTKGLVIQNGALTSFDAAVTGDIDIAGLKVHADKLRAT